MTKRAKRLVALGVLLALGIVLAACQARDGGGVAWSVVWPPVLALIGGVAGRAFVPYLLSGFKIVQTERDWSAWPPFEPVYLTTFATSAIGYAILLATVMGAFEALVGLGIREAIAVGYGLADLTRKATKPIG